MKKEFFIALTIFCLVSAGVNAQDRKGYIGITGGLSVPVGKFASSDLNDSEAGYADPGIRFNLINFGYTFGGGFGVAATWMGSAHPITLDAGFSFFDGTWAYGSLMAGPMYSLEFSDKINLDFRAMLGLTTVNLDVEGVDEDGTGLGIDLSATFRLNFANRWCVLANADFFSTNAELDNGIEQKIASLNLTGGIGFRL